MLVYSGLLEFASTNHFESGPFEQILPDEDASDRVEKKLFRHVKERTRGVNEVH